MTGMRSYDGDGGDCQAWSIMMTGIEDDDRAGQ
jgi:hypothetical protein